MGGRAAVRAVGGALERAPRAGEEAERPDAVGSVGQRAAQRGVEAVVTLAARKVARERGTDLGRGDDAVHARLQRFKADGVADGFGSQGTTGSLGPGLDAGRLRRAALLTGAAAVRGAGEHPVDADLDVVCVQAHGAVWD